MILCIILLFQILTGGGQATGGAKLQNASSGTIPPSGPPWSGIIDPSRAIDWSKAGFAIQDPTTQCANQTGGALAPSGGDDAAAINTLIAGCTGGGYVALGAGTFLIQSTGLLWNQVSNVVLKGSGVENTKLIMSGSINCLNGANYVCMYGQTTGVQGQPTNGGGGAVWTGDNGVAGTYAKGDTVLNVGTIVGSGTCNSVATCFSVGQMVVLDQRNDGSGFVTTAATASGIGLSPTSLSFPSQQTSTTSPAQTVTLTSTGTQALTITSIGLSGTNSSDFAQSNNCPISPSTLAINATCTITVTFTPTVAGTRTASVSISDDAAGSPHTVSLSGIGASGGGGGPPGTANWQPAFTNPTGCAIPRSISFNTSGSEIYLACRDGGFYYSTNGGLGWINMNGSIVFPAYPPYAQGWTIQYQAYDGCIIVNVPGSNVTNTVKWYKTCNHGGTWTLINPTGYANANIGAFTGCAMNPSGLLVCGGYFGSNNTAMFYSSNGGNTSALSNYSPPVSSIYSIYYDPVDQTVIVGTENGGTFCSKDNGATGVNIQPWVSNPNNGNQFGATADSNGNPIIATQTGIYRGTGSNCNNYNWTNTFSLSAVARSVFKDSLGSIYYSHGANANNPNTVMRSTNGGVNWAPWDTGIPQQLEAFQFAESNGMLYAVVATNDNNQTNNPSTVYSTPNGAGRRLEPAISSRAFISPRAGGGCSESGSTVTCNTTIPHGLAVGDTVAVGGTLLTVNNDCGSSTSNSTPSTAGYGGWWTVKTVPTTTSFTYTAATTGLPPCTGGHFNKDTGGVAVFDVVPFATENNNNYLGRICPNAGAPALLNPACTSVENSYRGVQEVHVITAINTAANQITIDPPIFMNNFRSSQAPGISWTGSYPAQYITGDGIQELTIDASAQTVRNNATIAMINAYKCWVANTRIISQDLKRITLQASMRIDVINNYFYGTVNTTNNNYGVNPNQATSSNLIENNICDNLSACVVDEGSFGNVEAYNYAVASNYASGGWLPETFSHHGITGMNLLEGNNSPSLQADVWHGATWGMTVFRSRSRGQDVVFRTTNTQAVTVSAHNRGENIVGNVLGTTGTQTAYAASSATVPNTIYALGFDQGSSTNIPTDSLVTQSLLRWGNYDSYNASNQWNNAEVPTNFLPYIGANPVPANRTLPPSFFLTAQPAFWTMTSGIGISPPWPAIGPDITASGALDTTCAVNGGLSGSSTTCDGEGHHAYQIPAQLCWNKTGIDTNYQQTATISTSAWSSNGFATIFLTGNVTIGQYEVITVSGVSPALYNGMFQVSTAVTAGNSITYALPINPGASGTGGTVTWRNVRSYDPHACYVNTTVGPVQPPTPPAGLQLTGTCPTGQVNVQYTCTLTATGGTSPYSYTEIGRFARVARTRHGRFIEFRWRHRFRRIRIADRLDWERTMPPGLTLSSAGVISGTPTQTGVTQHTIQITDSASHSATGIVVLNINQLLRQATLPQEWVNVHAADLPGTGVVTKYIHTDGSGDYPCTIAGLQQSMNDWAATPLSTWWHVIVDDSLSTTTGGRCLIAGNVSWVLQPKTTAGTPTGWIVYESAHPNALGTTVCTHTTAFPTVDPSPRNFGCNTTSGITDLQHMWGIKSTSQTNNGTILYTATTGVVQNIVIRDAELYLATGATTAGSLGILLSGGTTMAAFPTNIGFERDYIHGDYNDQGIGTVPVVDMMTIRCHLCWLEWSYMDQVSRNAPGCNWTTNPNCGAEGHLFGCTNAYTFKWAHNYLEGGEIGMMCGGGIPQLGTMYPPTDLEVRGNIFAKPATWIPTHYVDIKSNFEFKECVRCLVNGNIIEHNYGWSQRGQAVTFTIKDQVLANWGARIQDLTFSNNMTRHTINGFDSVGRSGGNQNGGGTSMPGKRWNIINNLLYDIAPQFSGSAVPQTVVQWQTNSPGNWNCTATRDAAGATVTLNNCTPIDPTYTNQRTMHAAGDPTIVQNCTDTTFNTDPTQISPPALPGTNGDDQSPTFIGAAAQVIIYANSGTPNATTTCTLNNKQGWWSESIVAHNTYATTGSRFIAWNNDSMGPPYCSRQRGITNQNDIFVPGFTQTPLYANNLCPSPGVANGAGLALAMDTQSLIWNHLIVPGMTLSAYQEWNGTGVSTPANAAGSTIWAPAVACPGATADQTCIGMNGMMSGAPINVNPQAPNDPLTFFALAPSSVYKAGGARQASDGKDMGADMNAIRNAIGETKYSGCQPGACGPTGPYPD